MNNMLFVLQATIAMAEDWVQWPLLMLLNIGLLYFQPYLLTVSTVLYYMKINNLCAKILHVYLSHHVKLHMWTDIIKLNFFVDSLGAFPSCMLCCAVMSSLGDFTLFSVLGSCPQTRDDLGCAVWLVRWVLWITRRQRSVKTVSLDYSSEAFCPPDSATRWRGTCKCS